MTGSCVAEVEGISARGLPILSYSRRSVPGMVDSTSSPVVSLVLLGKDRRSGIDYSASLLGKHPTNSCPYRHKCLLRSASPLGRRCD